MELVASLRLSPARSGLTTEERQYKATIQPSCTSSSDSARRISRSVFKLPPPSAPLRVQCAAAPSQAHHTQDEELSKDNGLLANIAKLASFTVITGGLLMTTPQVSLAGEDVAGRVATQNSQKASKGTTKGSPFKAPSAPIKAVKNMPPGKTAPPVKAMATVASVKSPAVVKTNLSGKKTAPKKVATPVSSKSAKKVATTVVKKVTPQPTKPSGSVKAVSRGVPPNKGVKKIPVVKKAAAPPLKTVASKSTSTKGKTKTGLKNVSPPFKVFALPSASALSSSLPLSLDA